MNRLLKGGNASYADLVQISDAIEAIKVPLGTQSVPALTCRELAKARPLLKSGKSVGVLFWEISVTFQFQSFKIKPTMESV